MPDPSPLTPAPPHGPDGARSGRLRVLAPVSTRPPARTPPRLITVSTATLKGDRRTNQDHTVVVDGALVVLDGATSWLPQDPAQDGGWYARTLGAALTLRLPGHGRPLAELLADAIADLRDAHALRAGRSPHSTVSILRWDADSLEALVLADSPVVVYRTGSDPDALLDDRLEPVGARARAAYRQYLRQGHGFDTRFAELLAGLQRDERDWRNRDGGFWVAESDPDAAAHALTRSWPLADVTHALVLTDGAAAGVLEYGLHGWTAIGAQALDRGPASVIADVHDAEASDPDGVRWPRSKRHDDKTVACLAVGAGVDGGR